jgi:23S rRNA pseudouridine2457 synthase
MPRQSAYILFHKPYGIVSRFTPEAGHDGLSSFGPFPPRVYAAGRLDADSEGLLLLTDDNAVKQRLTEPAFRHPRTYLVQVERVPGREALARLRSGIVLDGKPTLPADVDLLTAEPGLPPRPVPIRHRKTVETCWLRMILREGRNRQVRRMTAAVGYPALRLVRVAIGALELGALGPGESRMLTPREIRLLREALGLASGGTTSSGVRAAAEPRARRWQRGPAGSRRGRA